MKRALISFFTLLVLHTALQAATETKIAVGRNPDFVAVNSITNRVYSSNAGDGTVSVIDGVTNKRMVTVAVGGMPQGIAVNSATNQIYVALFDGLSSTVSVIDGSTNTVVASLPVPGATYIAANSATNRIYVSDSDNTVRVIDGESNSVIATISFSSVLEELAVDPVRNLIYVTAVGTPPTIGVIDGATNEIVNTISVSEGQFLVGLAVDPSLNQIYASDTGQMKLFVVNGATGTVVLGIALPGAGNPKHAALGTGHQVLVSDPSTGKIFFINGTTKALARTIHLLYSPWGLQVNPVTNKIYVPLSQAVFVAAIAP